MEQEEGLERVKKCIVTTGGGDSSVDVTYLCIHNWYRITPIVEFNLHGGS